MKFENTRVWGFEHALRGMRNAKNSWDRADSGYCTGRKDICNNCCFKPDDEYSPCYCLNDNIYVIGPNDMKLIQSLIKGGPEHRKFMRQIFVSVDITAPLYWY